MPPGDAEATRVAFMDEDLGVSSNIESAPIVDLDAPLMPDDQAATRVAFDDEGFDVLDAEEAPIADASIAGEDGQIDDLFVELIDE
jgi:hypothetical protein